MQPIKIFISSVQTEFESERKWLCEYIRRDALLGKFFQPFIFEELPAISKSAQQAYLEAAAVCDIYLGIYGLNYGYEDEDGISPTEREYDVATANSRYRLIFLKDVERTLQHPKETIFIAKVEQSVVRKKYLSYEELRSAVYAALIRYLEEKEIIRMLPFDATYHLTAKLEDIDDNKVELFVDLAQKKRGFPLSTSVGVKNILSHLNLIGENGRLTNAALLLFAKKPQSFFVTSEVKCAQFYGNEVTKPIPAYQVYQGDVFELIEQAVSFVMSRINVRVGTREKRTDVEVDYELPLEAVREAIVNAVTHRDYTSNGSVQIMLFRNRLEIWNPGNLPYGLTPAKLLEPHPSIPTNPLLANPVYLAGYIERMGTGTRDIVNKCVDLGLRKPEFVQNEEFKVTLWRKEDSLIQNLEKTANQDGTKLGLSWDQVGTKLGLSWDQVRVILKICHTSKSIVEIMEVMGVTNRTKFRKKYIIPLIDEELLAMSFPNKPNSSLQKYYITEKGKLLYKAENNLLEER
nr:DUF4062 domain-containing protein [uncultured Bacteroides sp.]